MPIPPTATYQIPGVRVVAPADLRLMTPFILTEQQDWFETEIHFIRRFLKPGMRVVDVGANYGCYTLSSASLVGPSGSVHAYEPASLPGDCLTESISVNGFTQVTLHRMALSDHLGTARLGIDDNAELNSLSNGRGAGEMVPLGTLATEQPGWGGPIDFLKLDAEGEEIRILAAAGTVLGGPVSPLVMFEYKHGAEVNHGLIEAIRSHGLTVWRLMPGIQALVPLVDGKPMDAFLLNLFACNQERADQLHASGLLVADRGRPISRMLPSAARDCVQAWWSERPWRHVFQPMADLPSLPFSDDYTAGMAHLLASESTALDIDARHAHLELATRLIESATQRHPTAARWMSLSRATMAAGRRSHSVQCLQRIDYQLASTSFARLPIEEPFLPPDCATDLVAPASADRATFLQCCIDEPFLQRLAFSIYYVGEAIRPLIDRMRQNPLLSTSSRLRIAAWDAARNPARATSSR